MSGTLRRETWVRAYIRAAWGGDGSQCLGVVEERVLYGGSRSPCQDKDGKVSAQPADEALTRAERKTGGLSDIRSHVP